jgi:hypothetical protein
MVGQAALLAGELEAKLHELHEMLAGPQSPARVLHLFVQSFSTLVDQCKAMLELAALSDSEKSFGQQPLNAAKDAYNQRNRLIHSNWLQDWGDPADLWTIRIKNRRHDASAITYEEVDQTIEQLARSSLRCGALADLVVRGQMDPAERAATPEISDRAAVLRGAFVLVGAGPAYQLTEH